MNNKLYLHLFLGVLICTTMAFCASDFAYKQVRIPLNDNIGVPFYKDEFDYYVDGFDIDTNGNFYFMGGDDAILACFSGDKPIFRKKFAEFKSNPIFLLEDKLYLLDYMFEKNNLIIMDKTNGNIISSKKKNVNNRINTFLFRDTTVIVELFVDNKQNINMKTERAFVLFSLTGQLIKQVDNLYNLPQNVKPSNRDIQYLGQWYNDYVFWDYDLDNRLYLFTLKNQKGEIIASQRLDEKIFGRPFYGNPIEHKKLRNGNLYILGHDANNVIITELPMNKLFNK